MAEFKVGDRVIVQPPEPGYAGWPKVGRVTSTAEPLWPYRVRVPAYESVLRASHELTLAPSRRADLSPDDTQAVHCYCAKESPLGSYTSSEGHYQEEDE